MTTNANGFEPPSFPPEFRVPIASLSPSSDLSTSHIAAQVVLIWPYSSSMRKFSLLLSEADSRPLHGRKQVKVTFLHGAAKAAQQSHVGIGDSIRLSLRGCEWVEHDDQISTPGKRVERDIVFRRDLEFEIVQGDGEGKQVRYESTGTPEPVLSPVVNGVVEVIKDLDVGASTHAVEFSTPVIRKNSRTSFPSYFDSPMDPFAEDKEFVFGRSAKRAKFAIPSGGWTLVDDDEHFPPVEASSPLKAREQEERNEISNLDADEAKKTAPEVIDLISPVVDSFQPIQPPASPSQKELPAEPVAESVSKPVEQPNPTPSALMMPPVTPAKSRAQRRPPHIDLEDSAEDSDATSTPRLMPMASPGLPLVSPLIRNPGVEFGYFPQNQNGVSELDTIGQPEGEIEADRRSSVVASSEKSSSDDSLVVLDEAPSQFQDSIPVEPDAVEDEDMYGAAQPLPPILDTMSAQKPRDALEVLEEFLQISSTVDKEPYQIEDRAQLQILGDGTEGIDERRAEKPEDDVPAVEIDEDEVWEEDAPSSTDEEASKDEEDLEVRPLKSRSASLDGAADDDDDDDDELPEHIRMLQDIAGRSLSHETLPKVMERIHTKVKPAVDEATHALNERPPQLPPTPAHTQEAPAEPESPPIPEADLSLLPTPDNTQEQPIAPSPSSVEPPQEKPATDNQDTETNMKPVGAQEVPQLSRRISQRLTWKSGTLETLSSPYFTPLKPQIVIPASPSKDEHLQPSSPQVEPPSSPTRPVTRRQKAIAEGSPVPEAIVEEAEVEEAEPMRDTTPRSGINTTHSYYTSLSALPEHFGQLVDVIAIAVDESSKPERAKSGPKDWHTTLRLVDQSLNPSNRTRTSVQIFRPSRQALPSANRGDTVLLRGFRVQTAKHKWMLLSTDSSAWAVFSSNPESRSMVDDATMSGPPVEYGRGETAQVKKLVQWWKAEGEEAHPVFGKRLSTHINTNGDAVADDTPMHASAKAEDEREAKQKEKEDILESIEPPTLSPRRTRRRNNLTDNIGNEHGLEVPPETDETESQSIRHQPPRRAKSKTPALTANGTTTLPQASPNTNHKRKASSPAHTRKASSASSFVTAAPATATTKEKASSPAKASSSAKASPPATRTTRNHKSPIVVHELRDGTKYVDDKPRASGGVVHELRDGRNYVDE